MGRGGRDVNTLLRLSKRRVYSSRISCSRGVKSGGEDLDGLVGWLVDIVGVVIFERCERQGFMLGSSWRSKECGMWIVEKG